MNDRELLELAAKAAGIRIEWNTNWGGQFFDKTGMLWNPLRDNHSAMQLAVKLRMMIEISDEHALASPQASTSVPECVFFGKEQVGHAMHDAESATRRAIVRAAANAAGEQA